MSDVTNQSENATPQHGGMPANYPKPRWLFVLVLAASFVLAVPFGWPAMLGESRVLFGTHVRRVEVAYLDDQLGGFRREGWSAKVYQIPSNDLPKLQAQRSNLGRYPLPAAMLIEGYWGLPWQSRADLTGSRAQRVAELFAEEGEDIPLDEITSFDDAKRLAQYLAAEQNALIGGWCDGNGDFSMANCFIYVLDLERGILIELCLVT